MARVTVDRPGGDPSQPPTSLLEAVDRWLHHPAIRGTLLLVCLAAMASLVLIVIVGGSGLGGAILGLASATTGSVYVRARRARRATGRAGAG